jgi:hypothetical protein
MRPRVRCPLFAAYGSSRLDMPSPTFSGSTAAQKFGRYWGHSGHRTKIGRSRFRRDRPTTDITAVVFTGLTGGVHLPAAHSPARSSTHPPTRRVAAGISSIQRKALQHKAGNLDRTEDDRRRVLGYSRRDHGWRSTSRDVPRIIGCREQSSGSRSCDGSTSFLRTRNVLSIDQVFD